MASRDEPDEEAVRSRLDDAPRLLHLRRLLREVAATPEARAALIAGPPLADATTVALLPGSYNPPTVAHLELAGIGLERGADAVLFCLATRTIDKEVVSGAALEDRLLLLELTAARAPRFGVLLLNRGLYVDQAAAVRSAFPAVRDVVFLVGYDKIVQIFDPRYYDDRDAALECLFRLARFLVAPRADAGPEELDALLSRPENRPFASAVRSLDFPPSLRDVASSTVRARISESAELGTQRTDPATRRADDGRADRQPGIEDLPPECRVFVTETGVYAPDEATAPYRRRLALLDELEVLEAAGVPEDELRARLRALRSPVERGAGPLGRP